MKKIVLTITLCVLALNAFAQKNGTYTKSINMELLGSSGMVGVNYDARFKGNHGWGYSAGIGYGYANSNYDFVETPGRDGVSHEIGIPVEVNYLFGKRNSHFVLGAGGFVGAWINEGSRKAQFGYTLFADVAYRYQKPTGFSFSVGLKPNLSNVFWPYITLGYSF